MSIEPARHIPNIPTGARANPVPSAGPPSPGGDPAWIKAAGSANTLASAGAFSTGTARWAPLTDWGGQYGDLFSLEAGPVPASSGPPANKFAIAAEAMTVEACISIQDPTPSGNPFDMFCLFYAVDSAGFRTFATEAEWERSFESEDFGGQAFSIPIFGPLEEGGWLQFDVDVRYATSPAPFSDLYVYAWAKRVGPYHPIIS